MKILNNKINIVELRLHLSSRTTDQKELVLGVNLCSRF